MLSFSLSVFSLDFPCAPSIYSVLGQEICKEGLYSRVHDTALFQRPYTLSDYQGPTAPIVWLVQSPLREISESAFLIENGHSDARHVLGVEAPCTCLATRSGRLVTHPISRLDSRALHHYWCSQHPERLFILALELSKGEQSAARGRVPAYFLKGGSPLKRHANYHLVDGWGTRWGIISSVSPLPYPGTVPPQLLL